ncbi:MAG: hypothetical protein MI702_10050, partial [Chlorobiales bacterium]|nr:hypothetical protein [Chlorobiales bacterium]
LMQALKECLKRLPQASRDLLYHRYADQENAQQLSKQLRISPVAVRLKLMRIRNAMKTCVEGKIV